MYNNDIAIAALLQRRPPQHQSPQNNTQRNIIAVFALLQKHPPQLQPLKDNAKHNRVAICDICIA